MSEAFSHDLATLTAWALLLAAATAATCALAGAEALRRAWEAIDAHTPARQRDA